MCNHCYHKYGRNSYADACSHSDRLVYAKGKCQNCYLNDYNKLKRRMKKAQSNGPLSPVEHNAEGDEKSDEILMGENISKRIKV